MMYCKLSSIKSQILPNSLKEKYKYLLGESSNTSIVMFRAEFRVTSDHIGLSTHLKLLL